MFSEGTNMEHWLSLLPLLKAVKNQSQQRNNKAFSYIQH